MTNLINKFKTMSAYQVAFYCMSKGMSIKGSKNIANKYSAFASM